MSDELLPYYNRELSFIRQAAGQFAEAHPKIAGRLRLGPEASEDPHVERLIEAFAYLTARVRAKLDDEFPEVTESLLSVLYPHYQAPVPSMSVVQFELDKGQNELRAGLTLPRHSALETDPIQGEPVRFRTCYPVTLWPIDVAEAELIRPPFTAPVTPRSAGAGSVLRLRLRCRGAAMKFSLFQMASLRFFLKGQPQHVYPLYELLLNNVVEVALARAADDLSPVVLAPDCLRPVGFERDEGLLPYTARSHLGYRLLTEYFTFPQKFLFFELAGLDRATLAGMGPQLDVYLFLDREAPDLEPNVGADTFRLGCAPAVNLYNKRAEPIQLTRTDHEYRVVPDSRRPLAHEVYAIERVTSTASGGGVTEYQPFFSVKHAADGRAPGALWHASRRPGEAAKGQSDGGTELYLALVDPEFQPAGPAEGTLSVETVCLNRDLPARLPFGGDQPRLQLSPGNPLVSGVRCLTAPTRTFRPSLRRGALWRLVSHLSLGHLSLTDTDGRPEPLREILKLYDFADSPETRKMIDGLAGIEHRRAVGRVRGPNGVGVCQGVEVRLLLDPDKFTGSGLFLFASVLERFLGLYCTINSFTRVTALVRGREGELRRWPARAGDRILV